MMQKDQNGCKISIHAEEGQITAARTKQKERKKIRYRHNMAGGEGKEENKEMNKAKKKNKQARQQVSLRPLSRSPH